MVRYLDPVMWPEMIQQKSVYRSNIGTLTRHSAEDQYWQSLDCYAIGHRAAVQKTERPLDQLLHSGAGDLTANNDHAVTSITQ